MFFRTILRTRNRMRLSIFDTRKGTLKAVLLYIKSSITIHSSSTLQNYCFRKRSKVLRWYAYIIMRTPRFSSKSMHNRDYEENKQSKPLWCHLWVFIALAYSNSGYILVSASSAKQNSKMSSSRTRK